MTNQRRILELLNGGDWACAFNERQSLAHVCRKLTLLLEGELSAQARGVAQVAATDMSAATRQWAKLATSLRSRRRVGPGAARRATPTGSVPQSA